MSIVGTRPPLISETNLYELHHRARLAIADRINNRNVAYGVVLLLTIVLTIVFALIAKRVIDVCFRRLKKAER